MKEKLTCLIASVKILLGAIIKVLFIIEVSVVDFFFLIVILLKYTIFHILQLAGLHRHRPVDPVELPLCQAWVGVEELLVSVSVLFTNPREHIFQFGIIYHTSLGPFEIKAGSRLPLILLRLMLS